MSFKKKFNILKNSINIVFFLYFITIGVAAYYYGNQKQDIIMLTIPLIFGLILYIYLMFVKLNYSKRLNEHERKLLELFIKYKKEYLKEIEDLQKKISKKIKETKNKKEKLYFKKLKTALEKYKKRYIENDKKRNLKEEIKGKNIITKEDVKMKEIEILKEEIKGKI